MKTGLKLVPYDPNDYSLSKSMTYEHGKVIDSPADVAAVLSLYFQWPDHRSSRIVNLDNESISSIECILSYDQDERVPTQLFVSVLSSKIPFGEFQTAKIRIEVFRTCYEFELSVLSVNDAEDGVFLVTTVPIVIQKHAARRLPRYKLEDEQCATIEIRSKYESCSMRLVEVGLKSFVASGTINEDVIHATLIWEEREFSVKKVRSWSGGHVFVNEFKSSQEVGSYFNVYRKIVYAHLRPKDQFSHEEVYDLYLKTGYFGKFIEKDKVDERRQDVFETWDQVRLSQHQTSADYLSVNEENKLVGASSLTLSYLNSDLETWFFHQLCAVKDVLGFESTFELYRWRAEYVTALPNNIEVLVNYDGRSRWLERLYTRYFVQANKVSQLYPVNHFCGSIEMKNEPNHIANGRIINFGKLSRSCHSSKLIGLGPDWLNVSGLLNLAILESEESVDDAISGFREIVECKDEKEFYVELMFKAKGVPSLDGFERVLDSRLCKFKKNDFIEFCGVLDHMIQVTKKKKWIEGDASIA